jgi:hypothetical protein
MLLTPQDASLFFELHRSLMLFVHQRLNVLGREIANPDAFSHVPPEERFEVRDALLRDLGLIDAFVDENPFQISDGELAIVQSWRHLVAGKFYLNRELKKYTVFLSSAKEPIAYGVTALTQSFEELAGSYRPILVDTVLLPFKGMIVYDGLLGAPGPEITFGPGIRRSLNEIYQQAKDRFGIVTSLPFSPKPFVPEAKRAAKPAKKSKPPAEAANALSNIVAMTDQFCREHLNEEYAELCRKLAEKLSRKRPSPLTGGKPNGWAAAIVRTIGFVNFLSDPSQSPHMKLAAIGPAFGVSDGTCQAKSTLIRKMFDITPMDVEWTLPSLMGDNPMAWLVQVDGLIVDIRSCPREMQQAAFEEGLIPYVPADRGTRNP